MYYILVHIEEYGWEYLQKTAGEDYIKYCILPNKEIHDDIEYYKFQAHNIPDLFGGAIWAVYPHPINANILIPE